MLFWECLHTNQNAVRFGVTGVIFVVCLSCPGLNQQDSKRVPADKKKNTELAIQVKASRTLVKLPPGTPDLKPLNCDVTENKVRLSAKTISTHKSETNFTWQVPAGRLIGKGRDVTWDLSGVQEGAYTANVEASDKHKHVASGSVTVTVVICPGERPDPPPCPAVWVVCRSRIESKGLLTFEANVAGGDPNVKLTYSWSLSPGKIISGQATPKLTVDVSDLSGQSVTATVRLGGINPLCAGDASCTTEIVTRRASP